MKPVRRGREQAGLDRASGYHSPAAFDKDGAVARALWIAHFPDAEQETRQNPAISGCVWAKWLRLRVFRAQFHFL
jgi:hypothetical protein